MEIRILPHSLQKKANEELNEVPSRIKDDLKQIREWIEKQPHLSIRTDDQHLLSFLRGCKFSLQKTKDKLDFFYSMRTNVPEFFDNRDISSPEIQKIFKAGAVLILPQSINSFQPPIFLIRWEVCDIETMSLVGIMKAILMSIDVAMNEDDNLIVSGATFVMDYTNIPLKYALQVTPPLVKKFILCLEKAYPIRLKDIYMINAPLMFDAVYGISKPFTSEKFKKRVHVYKHNDIGKFYADVSQRLLPKEYGGEEGSLSDITDEWYNKLQSYKEWFREDNQYCSNEKLRSLSSGTLMSDVLNMEGSFRKLNLD